MSAAVITYDNSIREDLKGRFDSLLSLLLETNSKMNLTAIREEQAVREKHFADSLAISLWDKWKDYENGARILDLGTGGGFPGLPLTIAYPAIDITMLDSVRKKLGFIDEAIGRLELNNARTLWARAEEAARREEHREAYDLVVSRAVAYLPSLVECTVPFLKEGGYFIAYKQAESDEEIQAAQAALNALNAKIEERIPYRLGADGGGVDQDYDNPARADSARCLLIIRKCGPTPERYPRRAGKPMKDPILNVPRGTSLP